MEETLGLEQESPCPCYCEWKDRDKKENAGKCKTSYLDISIARSPLPVD